MKKKNGILLMLFFLSAASGATWFSESGGVRTQLAPSESGGAAAKIGASGGALVYREKERAKFRMSREEWNRENWC